MMENEYFFLRNIHKALGLAPDNDRSKEQYPELFAAPDTRKILHRVRNRTAEERNELVELLRTNAQALGIHLHPAESEADAAAIVVEIIRSREPEFSHTKHVILHDHPDVAALQLWKRFTREAVTVHTTFSSDHELREKTIASFIGITALLRRDNLVADLEEAYTLLREEGRLDSMVFISGPSKTADIEAQMVHGAHGPREVHLIILPSSAGPPMAATGD